MMKRFIKYDFTYMAITLKDVAKLAGTSIATASATLNPGNKSNTRVGDIARHRILSAASELGYAYNPIAKSLVTGKTGVIGLMLPYADAFVDQNPFCATLLAGIVTSLMQRHYNLMLYTATSGSVTESSKVAIDSRVDGILLVVPPVNSDVFAHCDKRSIPYVSVIRDIDENACSVNCDDYTGGYMATKHLIDLGHRRIAHFVGNPDVSTTAARLEGYRAAMHDAGIPESDHFEVPSGFLREPGYQSAMMTFSGNPQSAPTAVFACNDLCAAGALQALSELGISVPDEVSIVGFDDTPFSASLQPPLTTIRMPIQEMGALAVELLVNIIEDRKPTTQQHCLPVSLTLRSSTSMSPKT